MKITMITSEANPLVKSGGLADVTYSLTKELNNLGHEAIIFLPLYKDIKETHGHELKEVIKFDVFMSWRKQYVGVLELKLGNIKYYLIDNEFYFKRDNLYGYEDDGERFAFFSLAAVETLIRLNYSPDIIHVHDWQAGMVPCLIKEKYSFQTDVFNKTKFCLTIHNPAFKGMIDKYFLNNFYGLSDILFDKGNVRFDGLVSTLKSAIHYADVISTVSPTHRDELLTYETSHGLNYILKLRADDFVGILNGIDVVEFDPSTDPYIEEKYTSKSILGGKSKNRKSLLKYLNIPRKENRPVFGLVSRLTWQKGIELILKIAPQIIEKGTYLIFLGKGEPELEEALESLKKKYPKSVGVYIGYNDELAHKIYAGSDFFLMPSLFEPCGISQMIAMRYGALPIARETGGLKDTVFGIKSHAKQVEANGFTFVNFDEESLLDSVNQAIDLFLNKKDVTKTLIKNAMKGDYSYAITASKYLELYQKALNK